MYRKFDMTEIFFIVHFLMQLNTIINYTEIKQ
jgi:hypothetical protein